MADMEIKHKVKMLNNGLTVVGAPNQSESVTVLALVHAGSRDEAADQYGAAHFLEHFVFKGTRKYPNVNDVSRVVDGIGGRQNAFTWNDYTGYWVKVAKDYLKTGIEVVGQLVTEPVLPEGEIDRERGTIVEELKMYEDNYPMKAWDTLESIIYPQSALGRPIIGTEESLKAMKIDNLKAFRSRWYFPENTLVVVAGGYGDEAGMRELVEQEFAAISKFKKANGRDGYNTVFTDDGPGVRVINKKTEQAHIAMGVRSFKNSDPRQATLEVLNTILGGNMSSRLWNEVREKRGLAYYVRTANDAHVDVGVNAVRAGVRLNEADEAVKVIKEQMELMTQGVTAEELKRGKEAVKGNLKLDWEDSQEVAMQAASDWALNDGQIQTMEEKIAEIEAVDEEKIKEVAKEVFSGKGMKLSVVGPFEDEDRFLKLL